MMRENLILVVRYACVRVCRLLSLQRITPFGHVPEQFVGNKAAPVLLINDDTLPPTDQPPSERLQAL